MPLNYTKIIPCFMGFHDITQLSARQQLGAKSGSGGHWSEKLWASSQVGVTVQRKEFEREESHYVRI